LKTESEVSYSISRLEIRSLPSLGCQEVNMGPCKEGVERFGGQQPLCNVQILGSELQLSSDHGHKA